MSNARMPRLRDKSAEGSLGLSGLVMVWWIWDVTTYNWPAAPGNVERWKSSVKGREETLKMPKIGVPV